MPLDGAVQRASLEQQSEQSYFGAKMMPSTHQCWMQEPPCTFKLRWKPVCWITCRCAGPGRCHRARPKAKPARAGSIGAETCTLKRCQF